MRKFKLIAAALLASTMTMVSCNKGGDDPGEVADSVTKVSISSKSSLKSMMVGDEKSMSVNVTGSGENYKGLDVTSSDSTVVKVETTSTATKFTLKALKAGTAKITVKSKVDASKTDEVEITVSEADWTASEKEMMEYYLGEVVPYVSGGFKWTDEYFEDYGCLTGEVSGDKAEAAYEALLAAGFEDDGSEEDDYYLAKDSVVSDDYYLFVNLYYYDGLTSIDVYMSLVEYEEWQTEKIAAYMQECGFVGTVPAYDAGENAGYTVSLEETQDGSKCVYITVTDYDEESDLGAIDYVYSLNSDNYFIIIDDYYGDYLVSPKDKSFTMDVYELQSEYYYGFEIIVSEYIPDETFYINESYEMAAVGGTLELTLEKGIDVPTTAPVWSITEGASFATIDAATGVLTGTAKGTVTVKASVGEDFSAETTVYVVDSVPTGFTEAQKTEINKIHEGLADKILFNKYFDSVEYDEEEEIVSIESSFYSADLTAYREALVADGWTDILVEEMGDWADLLYYFGYPYMFEKDIEIGGAHYFVSLELSAGYEEEGEFVQDFEGCLKVAIYDSYIYGYENAVTEFKALLAEQGVETTAELPEALPASHFYVGYDEEYNDIGFIAYDATGVTMQNVVDALKAKGWTASIKHVDASVDEYGDVVPAYDYIEAASADKVLEIEGYVEEGAVAFYIYLPEPPLADCVVFADLGLENGQSLTELDLVTKSGYSIEFAKAGNTSSEPKYYTSDSSARCYAKNTITISAPSGESLPSFTIYGTSKDNGSLSANVGTLTSVTGGYSWSGEANEVVLTVSNSGQFRITKIDLSAK